MTRFTGKTGNIVDAAFFTGVNLAVDGGLSASNVQPNM